MIAAGDCSDTLRAVGRFLELVNGTAVIISDKGDHVEIQWRGRTGEETRQWGEKEIQALRTSALMMRGTSGGRPTFGMGEFLRTIGRELDEKNVEGISVVETADGFFASGTADGQEFRRDYG